MAASSSTTAHTSSLKNSFKTPEGRHTLNAEKTYPAGFYFSHGKSVSQVTVANLKKKVTGPTLVSPSSSFSGVKLAVKFLGVGNGSRALSFGGGSGASRVVSASNKSAGLGGSSGGSVVVNYDSKGTYALFNVGDMLFVTDCNSRNKDPIKGINFSISNPVCHTFDSEIKDGHDLVIGLNSGDVYTASLRQQLQDGGKKLVGAQHYNKDGAVNSSRCTSVSWVPGGDGAFVVAHADGNLYLYDKTKESSPDSFFQVVKNQTHFNAIHGRSSKSNPFAAWHVCEGSINSISFSPDGRYLATVGRDGYLRVFNYLKEQLISGGKSYYGALLCCTWSPDGKYILAGGEDDLVQVWSMEEQKIVAWCEGHNSWVSGVAFDSYGSAPSEHGNDENMVYRFGSVGQDTQLLLWDLVMDELVLPIRRPPGGSPTFSSGSPSVYRDKISPVGTLQPAPSMRNIPKISPLVAHRAHLEPLSGLAYTTDSIVTSSRNGHIKVWMRPGHGDTKPPSSSKTALRPGQGDTKQLNSSETIRNPSLPKKLPAIKPGGSSYRQSPIFG